MRPTLATHRSLVRLATVLVAVILATLAVPLMAAPAVAATVSEVSPVYRFYKTTDGAHFFTSNESEKNAVNVPGNGYEYEGIAFYAYPAQAAGTSPVYRFYNTRSGVHFYTISENERQTLASSPVYRAEGVAYYAAASASTDLQPVYRFYKFNQGVHFYTDNADEAAALRVGASTTYRDEGIAYYLPSRLTLSGTGNGGTVEGEPIILPGGLNRFSFSYTGSGEFSMFVNREDGQYIDYLIKKNGPTESSVAVPLVEARYGIGVKASGPWTISIEFPKSSAGRITDFEGTGSQATALFTLDQGTEAVIRYRSFGEYFRVVLLDARGTEVSYPVFETGESISLFYPFAEPGLYILQVYSDGPWALQVR